MKAEPKAGAAAPKRGRATTKSDRTRPKKTTAGLKHEIIKEAADDIKYIRKLLDGISKNIEQLTALQFHTNNGPPPVGLIEFEAESSVDNLPEQVEGDEQKVTVETLAADSSLFRAALTKVSYQHPPQPTFLVPEPAYVANELAKIYHLRTVTKTLPMGSRLKGGPGGLVAQTERLNHWPGFMLYNLQISAQELQVVETFQEFVDAIRYSIRRRLGG